MDAPPQLKKLIARARKLHLGSAEFRTRANLIVTAVQTAHWLNDRPLGFLRTAQPSRVCNPIVRWDNCIASLYARGKATLDRARRAVSRFENFAKAHSSELSGGTIYPVDFDVLTWFIREESNIAETKKDASESHFKGTVASHLVKDLCTAERIFAANFFSYDDKQRLKEIADALKGASSSTIEDVAHMPLSALLFLEELALGDHSFEALGHPPVQSLGIVALTYARLFVVVIITAMRMIDVERATCKGVDHDGSARLRAFATKGVSWAKMTPMDIICPPTGALPEASGAPASARWFAAFMRSCVGREWLFPSYDSPPRTSGLHCWCHLERAPSSSVLAANYESLPVPSLSRGLYKGTYAASRLHPPRGSTPGP